MHRLMRVDYDPPTRSLSFALPSIMPEYALQQAR